MSKEPGIVTAWFKITVDAWRRVGDCWLPHDKYVLTETHRECLRLRERGVHPCWCGFIVGYTQIMFVLWPLWLAFFAYCMSAALGMVLP